MLSGVDLLLHKKKLAVQSAFNNSVKKQPKFCQNPVKMQLKCSQNSVTCIQNAAKMQLKFCQNSIKIQQKCTQNTV